MTNDIQVFKNEDLGASIRTVINEDGEPWFVAKDVCDALGIRTNTVRSIVDGDEVRECNDNSIDIAQNGGKSPLIVSEPGLYTLILKSRKPEARAFRRWVTHEVLPSIRRTGCYGSSIEEHYKNLLSDGAALIEAQKAKLLEIEPKAAFAEAVEASGSLRSIGELAKVINQAGVSVVVLNAA